VHTLDGFDPKHKQAFTGYAPRVADDFYRGVSWLADRLHVEVDGVDRLPAGRGLIVANHAFGWDVAFAMAEITRRTGRHVFALGEHLWWRVPVIRRLAAAVGVVDGTQDNADRLLASDELVLVLPGGMREAVKPRELRYRLLWGNRLGFVRAAVRNRAPIVPLACIGGDEIFELVGNAFRRGERWFHGLGLPIPRPAHWIPHAAQLRFVIGEPIPVADGDPADERQLKRLRHEVEGELAELIDCELSRRAGFEAC
jgi:1-acyl-sn-glycerol-3-phosphate acyltransferase